MVAQNCEVVVAFSSLHHLVDNLSHWLRGIDTLSLDNVDTPQVAVKFYNWP